MSLRQRPAGFLGKTIRIFLADGEPTGILLAEISNWTGKVLVAPRSQLDQLTKREEVRRTGVYLFVGSDPDDPSRALASIGEGDNVRERLRVRHGLCLHHHDEDRHQQMVHVA
jgi:hypothetical protein